MLKSKIKIILLSLMAGLALILSPVDVKAASPSAVLYISPASQSVSNGGTLTLNLIEDSGGEPINVINTVIYFSTDKLEFLSSDPSYSANGNRIDVLRFYNSPNPSGKQTITTLTFKVIAGSGSAKIDLETNFNTDQNPYSSVNSSNPPNNNILTAVSGGSYNISSSPAQSLSVQPFVPPTNQPQSQTANPSLLNGNQSLVAGPAASSSSGSFIDAAGNGRITAQTQSANSPKNSPIKGIIVMGLVALALVERALNYRKKVRHKRRLRDNRKPETIAHIAARINSYDKSRETVAELAARLRHSSYKQATVTELAPKVYHQKRPHRPKKRPA